MSKAPKYDDGGAAARALKAQQEAELASQNLKRNMAVDLATENNANVVAAGTADAAVTPSTSDPLKKRRAQDLASSLGINL